MSESYPEPVGHEADFVHWERQFPVNLELQLYEADARETTDQMQREFIRLGIRPGAHVFHYRPDPEGKLLFAVTPPPRFASSRVPGDLFRLTVNQYSNAADRSRKLYARDYLVSPFHMVIAKSVGMLDIQFGGKPKQPFDFPPIIQSNTQGLFYLQEAKNYKINPPSVPAAARRLADIDDYVRDLKYLSGIMSRLYPDITDETALFQEGEST